MTWVPAREEEPKRLAASLDRFARRVGAPQASSLGAVFSHWERLVGETIAAHSEPASLVQGTLVVTVDEPAWATELRYLGADILRRLEEVAGPGIATRVEVRVRAPKRHF